MRYLAMLAALLAAAGCTTTSKPEPPRAAEGLLEVSVEVFGME